MVCQGIVKFLSISLILLCCNSGLVHAHSPSLNLLPQDRFVLAGALGTLVGFGSGHAVADRYEQKGWVFTVSEGACLVAWSLAWSIAGPVPLFDILRFSGIFGFLGFRIWEIVDIWSSPAAGRHAELLDEIRDRRLAHNLLPVNSLRVQF